MNPEITNRNVSQPESRNAGRNRTKQKDKFGGSSRIKSGSLAWPVSETLRKEHAGSYCSSIIHMIRYWLLQMINPLPKPGGKRLPLKLLAKVNDSKLETSRNKRKHQVSLERISNCQISVQLDCRAGLRLSKGRWLNQKSLLDHHIRWWTAWSWR